MRARAVIFGIGWALFICGFTYYENQILGQTFFISHHLPISVFGVLIALWLSNPVWRRLRPGLELTPGELAIMVSFALAILLVALSTWKACVLAPSILLGWCIRSAVVQLGGSRGYRSLRPFMTGLIAGER